MVKNPLKGVSDDDFESIASRFRALGEVSRLQLIQALQGGEKNVSELVEITGLGQPNVSRHLANLVAVKIVGRRKSGLNVLYRVIDESLGELCAIVCKSVTKASREK